jgi:membrane associated rhomboid family serine protease
MTAASHQHRITDELKGIVGLLVGIWIAFGVSQLVDINQYGLQPRTSTGWVGIATSPFLHADMAHITGNSLPLLVLLCLLAGSRANSGKVVFAIIAVGGGLHFLLGRHGNHIGASGLVFGLVAFLILSGILERRFLPLLVSVVTLVLYGGTLLSGVLPTVGDHISWDGHLCSAIAGGLIAWRMARDTKGGTTQ